MKATKLTLLVIGLALLAPLSVLGQQVFDFNGQANVPTVIGDPLAMHSVLRDPAPALSTPIPLDFANFEYTLVITDLIYNAVSGFTQTYNNGTIVIYEDAATAADFTNIATFTDGTAILVGTINTLLRTKFPIGTTGSVAATYSLDWNGGTRLNDIAPEDQPGWSLLSGLNTRAESVEPGFDEEWDGKVEPPGDIVPAENSTWGGVKALFK